MKSTSSYPAQVISTSTYTYPKPHLNPHSIQSCARAAANSHSWNKTISSRTNPRLMTQTAPPLQSASNRPSLILAPKLSLFSPPRALFNMRMSFIPLYFLGLAGRLRFFSSGRYGPSFRRTMTPRHQAWIVTAQPRTCASSSRWRRAASFSARQASMKSCRTLYCNMRDIRVFLIS